MFIHPSHVSKPGYSQRSSHPQFSSHQPYKIRFYAKGKAHYGFTNFSPHGFKLDGKYWPTSEHYFQAQKFISKDSRFVQELIRNVPQHNPRKAFSIARKYDRYKRPDWDLVKDDIMRDAVLAKFSQNASLKKELLATGNAILVEDSPVDDYWGRGKDHKGRNMLGRILMETRTKLRASSAKSTSTHHKTQPSTDPKTSYTHRVYQFLSSLWHRITKLFF